MTEFSLFARVAGEDAAGAAEQLADLPPGEHEVQGDVGRVAEARPGVVVVESAGHRLRVGDEVVVLVARRAR